ncbi:MAG: 50S ribosomal protein L15, partial [Pirellulaceae bacterium]
MNIDEVNRGIQRNKRRRRIGRGPGSGWGKTAGKGHKGQKSRAGWSQKSTFQGGMMPLVRRIPKRGFHNEFAAVVVSVNVSDLEQAFEVGADVTPETLRAKHLARSRWDLLKVLGDGELTKKLKVSAHRFSATAREKIEKAGGEVVILPAPTPVAEKQKQIKKQKRLDA